MLRWAIAVVAACGSDATPRPVASPAPAAPPAAAAPPRHPFGDTRGPVVTADDVFLDGAPLGLAPAGLAADRASLTARLRDVPAAATLSYTDDAPAAAVLAILGGLFETGHPQVALVASVDGRPAAACTVTAAPADAAALELELQGEHVELGRSAVRPVLHTAECNTRCCNGD